MEAADSEGRFGSVPFIDDALLDQLMAQVAADGLELLSSKMTTRDVQSHIWDAYQVCMLAELLSKITDSI